MDKNSTQTTKINLTAVSVFFIKIVIVLITVLIVTSGSLQAQHNELTKKDVNRQAAAIVSPGLNTEPIAKVNKASTQISYASIGDYVWIDNNANGIQDQGEPGVPNIEVVLYDSALNIIGTKYTNDNGYYHFDKIDVPANGSKAFIVGFNNIPPDYAYTRSLDDKLSQLVNSKPDTISGRTKPFFLRAGEERNDIDGGLKSAPGVVLPFIIDQFNGNYSDGLIQLGWSTYSEINIGQFDIERGTDGKNFRQVGKINAESGAIKSNLNYSFLDITAPRGTNYYRLAIVDNNGNYTYSKTIMVTVDVKGISVMIVYPNPFSKRVQIRVNCDKAEKVAINVINSNGGLMSTQTAQTNVGDNNIVINKVDALPAGIYYIEVVSSTRSLKTKVVKIN